MKSKRWRICGALTALFFCIPLAMSVMQMQYAQKSRLWPSVSGLIISSDTIPCKGKGGGFMSKVRYKYSVGNKQLEGERIEYGNGCVSRADADQLTSRFAPGSYIKVHYEDTDVAESVLIVGELNGNVKRAIEGYAVLIAVLIFGGWLLDMKSSK